MAVTVKDITDQIRILPEVSDVENKLESEIDKVMGGDIPVGVAESVRDEAIKLKSLNDEVIQYINENGVQFIDASISVSQETVRNVKKVFLKKGSSIFVHLLEDSAEGELSLVLYSNEVEQGTYGLSYENQPLQIDVTEDIDEIALYSETSPRSVKIAFWVNAYIPDLSVGTPQISSGAVTKEKISDSSITTDKILDGAITEDKIAIDSIGQDKIKDGSVTASKILDGSVGESKISEDSISGGKIKDGAITKEKISSGSITEDKIADKSVGENKIKDGSITSVKIASNSVTSTKIFDGAVTEEKIKNGSIGTEKIKDGSITKEKIADGAFSTSSLQDFSVTEEKLADGSVTARKIADGDVVKSGGDFAITTPEPPYDDLDTLPLNTIVTYRNVGTPENSPTTVKGRLDVFTLGGSTISTDGACQYVFSCDYDKKVESAWVRQSANGSFGEWSSIIVGNLENILDPYALKDGQYDTLKVGESTKAVNDGLDNPISSFYGHSLKMELREEDYSVSVALFNGEGNQISKGNVNLPLGDYIVGIEISDEKEIVLLYQSGERKELSSISLVGDLATQEALDAEITARDLQDKDLEQETDKVKESVLQLGNRISDIEDGTTTVGAAEKLTTEDVGSAAKPVYFENGVPVACGDSLSVNITGTANNADNLGGKPASYYILKSQIEYGVRFALDENGNMGSAPTGQRVIRYNGAVTEWSPNFTPNVGNGTSVPEINENDFDLIPLFSPQLWTDNAGNAFRRFEPFYWGRQVMGGYLYIWVCETPLYSFYRMPQAFIKDGKVGYRDISVYEGAFETIGDVTYLCSKPGKNPAHNNTRTQFWQKAQAWQTHLSVDTNNEWYGITQISEITEILQPLIMIMFGTLNSQSVYNGVVGILWNYANTGLTVDAYNEGTMTLYFSTNALRYYRVGGTACINGTTTSEDYYRQIIANGTVTGTVSGSTFTPSDDGETYYYITISGTSFPATPTTVCTRSIYTGETDAIEATSGTLSNNGMYSFKVFGIENIWGNIAKQILDVSIYNYIPQKLNNSYDFTEFSISNYTQYYTATNYGIVELEGENGWTTQFGWQPTMPDVQLPISVGGSSATYYCDKTYSDNGERSVYFGGHLTSSFYSGVFYWGLRGSTTSGAWNYGARLSHWALIEKQ